MKNQLDGRAASFAGLRRSVEAAKVGVEDRGVLQRWMGEQPAHEAVGQAGDHEWSAP
jgi:hypothetical protein